ncbi:hypothetical protein GQ600_5429 [Phytophthora cactorum]|nr:hypothetical protein GQ600_5429 [Phytophthora cactorum]
MSLKMLLAPEPQKRPEGDFVYEKSGSKLLSYAEMLQDKIDKIEETRARRSSSKRQSWLNVKQHGRKKPQNKRRSWSEKLLRSRRRRSRRKGGDGAARQAEAKTTRKRLRQQCPVTSEPSSSTGSVRVAEVEDEVVETWGSNHSNPSCFRVTTNV